MKVSTEMQSQTINADDPDGHASASVLVLNAGSSSLKFALFDGNAPPVRKLSGSIDRIGSLQPGISLTQSPGLESKHAIEAPDHAAALNHLLKHLATADLLTGVLAVGHRVVHGGPRYRDPQRVDAAMLTELGRISSYDSEHLPSAIALLELVAAKFPHAPQIACFDTAFHNTLPRVARVLAIPRKFEAKGIQRYGFHGLSYAYLMQELARLAGEQCAKGRVVLAHLGNGASMAAVRDGCSVDTSMSLTPTSGLVMSTRSGDLDPGLFAFLSHSEQMTPEQFQHMVNRESGLLGISETSSDMRDLLALETQDIRASEAVAVFCYQAKKTLGAYAAALGGLDTLVFAGGIGENMPAVRTRICEGLEFLGIGLDESRNAAHASVISADSSRVHVRIIRTDEQLMIARSVWHYLAVGTQAEALAT